MIDFLFLYEIKARELESICLLRMELEKRGFTVAFYNLYNLFLSKHKKIDAKVVIVSSLLNDDVLHDYIYTVVNNPKKVVNLQWEQIFTPADESKQDSFFNITGVAKQAIHISWGPQNKRNHLNNGLDNNNVKLTGPIQMDFLRPEMSGFYLSKNEIVKKFNIPDNKKICLFISSFSYVDIPKSISESTSMAIGDHFKEFIEISIKSQEIILNWIDKILNQDKDLVYIYRPHPAEHGNKNLKYLQDKYENFLVISDLSVKQWILVCDTIYTWYSSSIAEIFFAKKSCYILRPIKIDENIDLTICKNGHFIENFDDFEKSFKEINSNFPVPRDNIYDYYYVDDKNPSYVKICNLLEDILKTTKYDLKQDLDEYFGKPTFIDKLKKTFIFDMYNKLIIFLIRVFNISKLPCPKKIRDIIEYRKFVLASKKRNEATIDEIEVIMNKIKEINYGKSRS